MRPFKPLYVSKPLVSTDVGTIRQHYGLQCKGKPQMKHMFVDKCKKKEDIFQAVKGVQRIFFSFWFESKLVILILCDPNGFP